MMQPSHAEAAGQSNPMLPKSLQKQQESNGCRCILQCQTGTRGSLGEGHNRVCTSYSAGTEVRASVSGHKTQHEGQNLEAKVSSSPTPAQECPRTPPGNCATLVMVNLMACWLGLPPSGSGGLSKALPLGVKAHSTHSHNVHELWFPSSVSHATSVCS